jgi:uncharacterized membrane protein YgcG
MKKLLAAISLVFSLAAPAGAQERILEYTSNITVNSDASLDVNEHITVQSEGRDIRRGIYRDFPTVYKDKSGRVRRAGFTLTSTMRDGHAEPYHTQDLGGGIRVYLGDSNVFLQPGVYSYDISYHTTGWMRFFDKYDELYWNVTGNGWKFPIDNVRAIVNLPPGANYTQLAAYTGYEGATGKDYSYFDKQPGQVIFTTTRMLGASEGLTVAVGFPKGFIPETTPKTSYWSENRGVMIALLFFGILLTYYYKAWDQAGRNPKAGTIIPLFSPPANLSPAECSYINDMGGDASKQFTASIVNSAVKGYLDIIYEGNKKYTLKKNSHAREELLSAEEKEVMENIFLSGDMVLVGGTDVAIGKRLSLAQAEMGKVLKKKWANKAFITNGKYILPGIFISLAVMFGIFIQINDSAGIAGVKINEQDFQRAPAFFFIAFWSIFAFGILYAFIWTLKSTLAKKSGSAGIMLFLLLFLAAFFGSELYLLYKIGQSVGMLTPALIFGTYFLNYWMPAWLKAPTTQGRSLMDKIEGFKMYLDVAEVNRMKIFNPPEVTPDIFEKYLPYAIALDLEQQWGEKFAQQLAKTGASNDYHPLWYGGSSFSSHNFSDFGSGLSSGLSSSISSSTSSGSGGGGSSGGGGGGGGGGGW